MFLKANYFKIFPEQDNPNHKWISWYDSIAHMPLTGSLKIMNADLQLSQFNYANILRLYFAELLKSVNSGDYSQPDKILGYIDNIQRELTPPELLPGKTYG